MTIVIANPRGYTDEIMLNEQRKFNEYLKRNDLGVHSLYFHPR